MDNRYIKEQNRNRQMALRLRQRNGMGQSPNTTAGHLPQNPQPWQPGQPAQAAGPRMSAQLASQNPQGNMWQKGGNSGTTRTPGGFPGPGNSDPGWRGGYQSGQEGGSGNGAQALSEKFSKGILSGFRPGNLGDINSAIWPFWFQFSTPANGIVPGQSLVNSFSVTQEAGYLLRQISQVTFLQQEDSSWSYIDPFYFDEGANSPNGLVFSLEDASSSRNFNGTTQKDIACLGNANFPWIYPSTMFMLPNQTMFLNLSNTTDQLGTGQTFMCFVTVMGYRVRVADAARILSTVSG